MKQTKITGPLVCPRCGGSSFHESGDPARAVDCHGAYEDGSRVRDEETALRCDECGNGLQAWDAQYIGTHCRGKDATDGLHFPSLEIVTLFLKRLFRMVERFEECAGIDLAPEFDELADIFGHARVRLAMTAMYRLGYDHVASDHPVPDNMGTLTVMLQMTERPFYDFIETAMNHATNARYWTYMAIANRWVSQGRHHPDGPGVPTEVEA